MPFLDVMHVYFRGERIEALYFIMWTTLVLVGLGLRFGLKSDWADGVGPAIVLIGAMGFLVDSFAERRARPYTQALEVLAAEHGLELQAE